MIKLVIDSGCDLLKKDIDKDIVRVLPIPVYFDGIEYIPNENITNEEFYEKLKKEFPHTSQVNVSSFEDVFKEELEKGNQVICLTISSKVSGTYNNAVKAKENLNNENISIIDSGVFTSPYGALVLEAVKLIKKGLNYKEIISKIESLKTKVKIVCFLNDLKYAIKGGRVKLIQGMIASFLMIKPIITEACGVITIIGKVIGVPKALNKIVDDTSKANIDFEKPVYICHANDVSLANKLRDLLLSKTKIKTNNLLLEVGPTSGTYTGPNCVGTVYFEK
jgi:DegV family protein with EDD domain